MAYVNSTTVINSGTVAVPSGVDAGVWVFLILCVDSGTGHLPTNSDFPTGFNLLATGALTLDGQFCSVAAKLATGPESGNYVVSDTSSRMQLTCIAFSGRQVTTNPTISTTNTVDVNIAPSPANVSANGLTASDGDDLIFIICTDSNNASGTPTNALTAPSGYTLAQDTQNVDNACGVAYKENVSAGSTGTVTGVFTFTDAAAYVGWLIRVPKLLAAIAGSITASITEADIVAGGKVLTITLTGAEFVQ
jgi:hypothetical protein